jgi:hypothetical protein
MIYDDEIMDPIEDIETKNNKTLVFIIVIPWLFAKIFLNENIKMIFFKNKSRCFLRNSKNSSI